MASGAEERIRELTQRMLRRKLYVVFSTATSSPDRIKEILPLHLEYMIGLERKGLVFASGPHDALFFTRPFYDPATFSWTAVSTGTALAALTYIGFDNI